MRATEDLLFAGLQFGFGRSLPMVLQTEAAECGLACLSMVARYHGYEIDLPGLRRRFSASLKGATLARLIEVAGELRLDSRPLRLEMEHLSQLRLPSVLHWDLDHFVVLRQVGPKGITIHDPARGIRKLTLAEASKSFTGIALELTPAADFKTAEQKQAISLRALSGNVRGLGSALVRIFLLAIALEVFGIVSPFYTQWVIDQVLVSADRSLLTLLGIGRLGGGKPGGYSELMQVVRTGRQGVCVLEHEAVSAAAERRTESTIANLKFIIYGSTLIVVDAFATPETFGWATISGAYGAALLSVGLPAVMP